LLRVKENISAPDKRNVAQGKRNIVVQDKEMKRQKKIPRRARKNSVEQIKLLSRRLRKIA
jgi:hypothetical protein